MLPQPSSCAFVFALYNFFACTLSFCKCSALCLQEKLGLILEKEDEMECLVGGCNFLLKAIRHEAFTYANGSLNFVTNTGKHPCCICGVWLFTISKPTLRAADDDACDHSTQILSQKVLTRAGCHNPCTHHHSSLVCWQAMAGIKTTGLVTSVASHNFWSLNVALNHSCPATAHPLVIKLQALSCHAVQLHRS